MRQFWQLPGVTCGGLTSLQPWSFGIPSKAPIVMMDDVGSSPQKTMLTAFLDEEASTTSICPYAVIRKNRPTTLKLSVKSKQSRKLVRITAIRHGRKRREWKGKYDARPENPRLTNKLLLYCKLINRCTRNPSTNLL